MKNLNEAKCKPTTQEGKKKKFKKVVDEMRKGTLKTSAGKKLDPKDPKDRRQALAIAYSEANMSKKKNESKNNIIMPSLNEWFEIED